MSNEKYNYYIYCQETCDRFFFFDPRFTMWYNKFALSTTTSHSHISQNALITPQFAQKSIIAYTCITSMSDFWLNASLTSRHVLFVYLAEPITVGRLIGGHDYTYLEVAFQAMHGKSWSLDLIFSSSETTHRGANTWCNVSIFCLKDVIFK